MSEHNIQPQLTHVLPGEGAAWWVVGDTYTVKATARDTNGQFALIEASIPPQAGPPPHLHRNEDEAYYVLEGELEVFDGERSFTARAGSFVYIPRGAVHAFRNPGSEPVRMLALITPGGFENFFFEVGQPARAGEAAPPLGAEEMERTLVAAPKYGMDLRLPTDVPA